MQCMHLKSVYLSMHMGKGLDQANFLSLDSGHAEQWPGNIFSKGLELLFFEQTQARSELDNNFLWLCHLPTVLIIKVLATRQKVPGSNGR